MAMILRGLGARSRLRPGAALVCARQLSRVPPVRLLQPPHALRTPALLAPRSVVCRTALLCTKPPAAGTKVVAKAPKAPPPAKWSPRWVAVTLKEVALHYWHGSKLLAADTRIASKLLSRLVSGRNLSRREHNLLVRVLADLGRVIPLSFFVLVPFMEFALPFALKLFPNLLPSTFEEKHQKDEKLKKALQMRLGVAMVLNDTLESRAKQLQKAAQRAPSARLGRAPARPLRLLSARLAALGSSAPAVRGRSTGRAPAAASAARASGLPSQPTPLTASNPSSTASNPSSTASLPICPFNAH